MILRCSSVRIRRVISQPSGSGSIKSRIIKEYSLVGEGVKEIKQSVNRIVRSKTKEEYDLILKDIEDLAVLAERDPDSPQAKFAQLLRSKGSLAKVKDIENDTDRARMIEKRINDMKELQAHREKRNALRAARKAATEKVEDGRD